MALGAAVQVDAVGGGFEDVADGDAVASDGIGAGFDEGQKAVFAYFMLSGTAFYRQEAKGVYVMNVPEVYRWNGTIILLRLPLETPKGFEFYDYVE